MIVLFIGVVAASYFIAAAWEMAKADGYEPSKSTPGGHVVAGLLWLAMGAWGLYVLARVA